jgi:hypothetical protein
VSAFLLMLHALAAVALLGSITHQCVASWRRVPEPDTTSFVHRFGSVTARVYATPVVALYVVNFCIGCVLYADYRVDVRPALESTDHLLTLAIFESKEHLAVYGLGLLPGYWALWRSQEIARVGSARRIVTTLLAFFVWWGFLSGLFVNNIAGMPA